MAVVDGLPWRIVDQLYLTHLRVYVRRFSLGDKPPQVTGIKVYHTDAASDTVVLEAEAMWASHQDVQLTVRRVPVRHKSRQHDAGCMHGARMTHGLRLDFGMSCSSDGLLWACLSACAILCALGHCEGGATVPTSPGACRATIKAWRQAEGDQATAAMPTRMPCIRFWPRLFVGDHNKSPFDRDCI